MKKRSAFTLIELLVVIAIIALLLSIGIPSLRKAKNKAMQLFCFNNLHNYGIVMEMYLQDYDDAFPCAWTSLYAEFQFPGELERYCRWHNEDYDLEEHPEYAGPLWPYMAVQDVHLCPFFVRVGKQRGAEHPYHRDETPIVPINSYSMNALLGPNAGSTEPNGVLKKTEVKRISQTFFYAEENVWLNTSRAAAVVNDNALVVNWNTTQEVDQVNPPFVDCFGSFHNAPPDNLDAGLANAVFADGHAEYVHWEDSYKLAKPR
jgi:prepilin-type N-terminal cleavage/methylation domain-containing protein/prepilin-type processing-associated H-X9-DG protein